MSTKKTTPDSAGRYLQNRERLLAYLRRLLDRLTTDGGWASRRTDTVRLSSGGTRENKVELYHGGRLVLEVSQISAGKSEMFCARAYGPFNEVAKFAWTRPTEEEAVILLEVMRLGGQIQALGASEKPEGMEDPVLSSLP